MAKRRSQSHQFDDDEEDFEPDRHLDQDYDEFDGYDSAEEDEEEPTISCPYCRGLIHEDAQKCHHCDRYISSEDRPVERKPWWIYVGVALCLYAVLQWFL